MGYEQHLTAALERKRKYDQTAQQIRQNARLSGEGKAELLEREREAAAQDIAKLREQYHAGHTQESADTARKLFAPTYRGAPPTRETIAMTQMSYRDALARAEGIQSKDEAMRRYGRAAMVGDDMGMKALAAIAWERGWQDVLSHHVQLHPDDLDTYNRLVQLASVRSLASVKMDERIAFAPPAVTPEEAQYRAALLKLKADQSRADGWRDMNQQLRGQQPQGGDNQPA